MGHPCKISVPRDPRDHCYGRDVQKFGKIRTSNFEYLNSGGPSPAHMDHSCKFLASWDANCDRDAQSHTVTDTGDQVAIIY